MIAVLYHPAKFAESLSRHPYCLTYLVANFATPMMPTLYAKPQSVIILIIH